MFEVKVFTNTYSYNMFQFHYLKVIFVGTTVIPNLLSSLIKVFYKGINRLNTTIKFN